MLTKKILRVGTRQSPLAIKQTKLVISELASAYPELTIELVLLSTKGDRDKMTPFSSLGKSGIFSDDVEVAILTNRIDCAVHSLKDLPVNLAPNLMIASTPKREIPFDCLILDKGTSVNDLPSGARIGTSSLRREVELQRLRSDLTMVEIRGNIDQRLAKLKNGYFAGIILAQAGLNRLGWDNSENFTVINFTEESFLPSVGQAVLAIECRTDDMGTRKLLEKINHKETFLCMQAERAFLSTIGDVNNLAIAGYAKFQSKEMMKLTTMLSEADGTNYFREIIVGKEPFELGEKAALALQSAFEGDPQDD